MLIEEIFTLLAEYAVSTLLMLGDVNCSKSEKVTEISLHYILRANCSICLRPVKICIDSTLQNEIH